ncbi:MAG TPA: hypothetical protein VGD72_11555 [Mycobacteriales bacterium]|jgi:hypothetical protein
MTETDGVLVSVQHRGSEGDPVGGHVAQGVLVAPDLVLVPALPRAAATGGTEFDVLFAAPAREPERVPAAYTVAHALDGDTGDPTAFVRLARPVSYPVLKPRGRPAPRELALPMAAGAVTDRLRAVPPTATAEPLAGVQVVRHPSPAAADGGICDWVPWCDRPPDSPQLG